MKILGNILLLPIKLICLAGILFSFAGIILSTIFEAISNTILSFLVTICIIIIAIVFFLSADSFLNINDIFDAGRIAGIVFIVMIIVSLIPLIFIGLKSFLLKGLNFWF
jgi:hypothetical protein